MWSIGRGKCLINKISHQQSRACQQSIVHCEGGSHHEGNAGSAINVSNFIYNVPYTKAAETGRASGVLEALLITALEHEFPRWKDI